MHLSWHLSQADVAERERAGMVTLERNVAFPGAPEIRIQRKLARLDPGLPIRTPQLVFEQLESVQPVFNVCAFRKDSCPVPFTDPPQMPLR